MRDPATPALLFACGLVAPYLFYYDATTFLLPLLVLWSFRARMGRGQLGLLIGLTVGYYSALPAHQYLPEGWSGPPWATLVNVGLWALSLWVALGRRPVRKELAPAAGAE